MELQKAVLYARVSSREQERDGYSIPAQIKLIEEFAKRNGYVLVEHFIDVESAGKVGRKSFSKMLEFVGKRNDISSIVCHKVDRLYRNLEDYVTVARLRAKREVKTVYLEAEYGDNAQGKLMEGIALLMAKYYIDNLADEVKKGNREKIAQGGYPGNAPLGYLNDKTNKTIYPDPVRAPFVKMAFEKYATGVYTLRKLSQELYEKGFRSRNELKVNANSLFLMLINSLRHN